MSNHEGGVAPIDRNAESQRELSLFIGGNEERYRTRFASLSEGGLFGSGINWAALAWGPLWAATRGMWMLFWLAIGIETTCGVYVFRAFRSAGETPFDLSVLGFSVAAFVVGRLAQGLMADRTLSRAFQKWRHGRGSHARFEIGRLLGGGVLTLTFSIVAIYRYGVEENTRLSCQVSCSQDHSTIFIKSHRCSSRLDGGEL